jgi:hypothetical protein
MQRTQIVKQIYRHAIKCVVAVAAIFLATAPSQAQKTAQAPKTAATPGTNLPMSEDFKKYPGLLPELGQLLTKLQRDVQSPTPRSESRLLPLLPESTTFYVAIPNYGDVAHQTLDIFHQELQQSAVLRDWWAHGQPAPDGPKFEEALAKFDQLHQFLGDEIALSGSLDDKKDPKVIVFAELRKPGLDKFLQQWINQSGTTSKSDVHVLTPQDLASAKDTHSTKDLFVLVRPDFVVATYDLATLRNFSAHLKTSNHEFVSTPFGQRVAQEYHGGATLLAAADLHNMVSQIPLPTKDSQQSLQRSGFADVKYLVWKHAKVGDKSIGLAELSFTGPRRGIASWLGKPAPLGSLDFVSPKAAFASTLVLASLSKIYDDIKDIAGPSSANAFAGIAGGEKALNLSLKDDLLNQLSGELTVEVDSITPPKPEWKTILKVNDTAHVQKTLNTLFAAAQMKPEQNQDAGVTSYTIKVPSGTAPVSLTYAFVDGYLVIASSPESVAEAVRVHTSGESLAKSEKFLASLPPGHSAQASGMFYQNPGAAYASSLSNLSKMSPEVANVLGPYLKDLPPSVARFYGEESSIRSASSSGPVDVSTALIFGAIAIPNLLRSRTAANESSAVGSIRTMNTAEITYSATYPQFGFASNLAALGPDAKNPTAYTPNHAGLLDGSLAGTGCIKMNGSCTKNGYSFVIVPICGKRPCTDFITFAAPVEPNSGTRSFCSTSDGIIRFKPGLWLLPPQTPAECRKWPPLQ